MSVAINRTNERKLTVPFVLLILSLLALLVSLLGLARTAALSHERLSELQIAWESVQDGTVEGSELVATDRLMMGLQKPVPAAKDAAYWSLGLAIFSMLLLGWLVVAAKRVGQVNSLDDDLREKNEQAAMLRLMDEMAPLASGDLRVQATVTDSTTGALADAFNYAVSELRWLVGTQARCVEQINESVERSRCSADSVAKACADQSGEIHRSSNELLTLSGAMADLSADAVDSAMAAQAAVQQAERGAQALAASQEQLSAIRDETDETSRVMHRLMQNLGTIDERLKLIEEAAKRTDLLALNTTIRASSGARSATVSDAAGDLGRLSDEVAQLADVLNQATRDIGALSSAISQDASDTVQSMTHTTSKLTAGVELKQTVADALQAVLKDSESLRKQLTAMADKSVEQSGVVRKLSENMDVINRITQQTSEGVLANADSLNELQDLAIELRQSLSDFRLPDRLVTEESLAHDTVANSGPSQARKAADRAAIHE